MKTLLTGNAACAMMADMRLALVVTQEVKIHAVAGSIPVSLTRKEQG